MFNHASEMDDLQDIALDYFFRATKCEGMRQWPNFYRECEMDGYRYLAGFPF